MKREASLHQKTEREGGGEVANWKKNEGKRQGMKDKHTAYQQVKQQSHSLRHKCH